MLSVSDYDYLSRFYKKNFKKIFKKKYHKKTNLIAQDKKKLKDLKNNGFCILKNVFSKKLIDEINLDFQKNINILR